MILSFKSISKTLSFEKNGANSLNLIFVCNVIFVVETYYIVYYSCCKKMGTYIAVQLSIFHSEIKAWVDHTLKHANATVWHFMNTEVSSFVTSASSIDLLIMIHTYSLNIWSLQHDNSSVTEDTLGKQNREKELQPVRTKHQDGIIALVIVFSKEIEIWG